MEKQTVDYKKVVRAISANKNLSIGHQINSIKENVNPGDFKEALKLLPGYNKHLHKTPFFKTINDIHLKEPYSFTQDFKREFRWLSNNVELYLEAINLFVGYKNKFEYYFLLEDYLNAKKILEEIEIQFGISLWSIEANLLIAEYLDGSEANWNKLSYYLKEIKNSIYEFVISSVSKRIESRLSHDNFISQFQNDLDNTSANGFLKDFFVFRSFPCANYNYSFKNLESVLYVANIFSIIDQYQLLIGVINYNVSNTSDYDKLFHSFVKRAKEVVANDQRVINVYNLINEKSELVCLENSDNIIAISNHFYNGEFGESLKLSSEKLVTNPMEFELYEVYCKSLINLGLDFKPLNISNRIDSILENTYNLLLFKNEEGFKSILKNSLLLIHTDLGKQIQGLISEVEGYYDTNYVTSFLSATFNSFKNVYFWDERRSIEKNFSALLNEHCFKVYRFKYGNDVDFKNNISKSEAQRITFLALNLFSRKEYSKVIDILSDSSVLDESTYYLERKIGLLFYSYLGLEMYLNALNVFGEMFFHDNLITKKLNYDELYQKIKSLENKQELVASIDYPILYSLSTKEYDLFEAYDEFMFSIGYESVLDFDIESLSDRFSLKKIIYFLYEVATIDTIKYSTDYGSINEVEEDRIRILVKLIEINASHKITYQKEIDEIYRINSVRKVLKEVDEGRLYIDISNLKAAQVKKFDDSFVRYKAIEQSSVLNALIGFNPANAKNWDKALVEKTSSVGTYNDADYLAFKSIYLESRDNFLFSKEYGLDSCLSTRIRHGALKNHIRSVFEKLDVITSKLDNKYKDNLVWSTQLIGYPELDYKVQSILKSFSREVDDYSIFIVENLIQIQTEKTTKKEDGLFTFFTNDEVLFKFYNQNKHVFASIEATIDIILSSLTNRTLIELQVNIEKYFSEVILARFVKIIEDAVLSLRALNLPAECQVISNLLKSNTEIQNELESISKWFYLNTTNPSTLLDINTVVSASVELMNKINPNFRISPDIELRCEPFATYSSLIFVFNILFNNIIEHSKLDPEQLKLKVEIDKEDPYFIIKVTNNLSSNCTYEFNNEKLQKVKDNWNDHSRIDRSNNEGESGFDKIKRILLYETYSKTEKFDFIIQDNTISIHLFFPRVIITKDE